MSVAFIKSCYDQLGSSFSYECELDNINNFLVVNKIKLKIINGKFCGVDKNYMSDHLARIINNYFKTEKFLETELNYEDNVCNLLFFLNEIFPNIYKKCTICSTNIYFDTINICDNINCKYEYSKIVTDDYVSDSFHRDKNIFSLLLYTAYACLYHPKVDQVMSPFPKHIASNITELFPLLKYNLENLELLLNEMKKYNNDIDLQTFLGIHEYTFIKFVLKTNITNFVSSKLFDTINEIQTNENLLNSSDVLCFYVKHEPVLEERFNVSSPKYLFHGSSLANWYSILRNGIKNCSGTALMANGAAYGSGVYLSNSSRLAYGYGGDKYTNTSVVVVGVVQVIGNSLHEHGNILVEPNDQNVLLRYILVLKKITSHTFEELTKYFISDFQKNNLSSISTMTAVVSKRLSHDTTEMTKICNKHNWTFEIFDISWKIKINNELTLCVMFSKNYPVAPPFIWFENTCYLTDNTTKFGSVVLNEIVPKNWKITIKIHKIIEKFLINTLESNKEEKKFFEYTQAFNDYSLHIKSLGLV